MSRFVFEGEFMLIPGEPLDQMTHIPAIGYMCTAHQSLPRREGRDDRA